MSSILQSHVLTMDETPIKAGHKSKGKLQTGYFWPIYGDQEEIAFPFAVSRAERVVREALGSFCGVLVTDGYKVCDRFVQSVRAVVHAQCWSHARRRFVDAVPAEPTLVAQALEFIGTFYTHETFLRERQLTEEAKGRYRTAYVRPVVEQFFAWLEGTLPRTSCSLLIRFGKPPSTSWSARLPSGCSSPIPPSPSIPIIWSGKFVPLRSAAEIGSSAGQRWARATSASSRA